MNLQLPEAIKIYFKASNSYESKLLAECFAEDAILYDEGRSYHGPAEIEAHIIEANNNVQVKSEITKVVEKNGETVVTATISGNFIGSPVALDYHFIIKKQKISMLQIVLSEE